MRRKLLIGTLLFFATIFASPSLTWAISWQDAISKTEAKSEELWRLAQARGLEGRHLGTAYNELHSTEHRCSIIGRMIGKAEYIKDIEKSTEIDVTTADAHGTGLAAQSLSGWAYSAQQLLDTDEAKRIREWNLDCVGHLGIPDSAYVGEVSNKTFYDVDGSTLRVMGDVESGFANKLRQAVINNPGVREVALGSGGGSVYEALSAGRFIRARGLTTILWNNFYSACTMVFIGGTERRVMSPYPELSFHQVSRNGVAIPFQDETYLRIVSYVTDMGVDVTTFMALMLSSPPSSFTTPQSGDLCQPRIATWVQRLC